MDELLTEQQQVEQVKGWLRENGFFLVAGVVLGLLGLFGWNQWNRYQERKAEEASTDYETFRLSVRANELEKAEEGMARLARDYGSSPYADHARLAMARLYLGQSKPDRAAEYLQQVVSAGVSEAIRNIARLRLARVLIFQAKYADALKVLTDSGGKAFAPAFHDVRGDLYFAMGKAAEARSEYEQALNGDPASRVIDRPYVQAKLDDLGGATAALVEVPGAGTPATAGPAAALPASTPASTPPSPAP